MLERLKRPSPGLVVAIIALFVALGGTSYAAIVSVPRNSVGTAQLKNGAVTASKINKSAHYAQVVYAHVLADGTVDTTQSKGIKGSMVHLRAASAFCFSGLPFKPKGGSATIDYGHTVGGSTELALLQISSSHGTDCNSGEHVEVATSSTPGTFAPEAFYVVIYG